MNFAKKSLGQNFLIDKNILKKIVNFSSIKDRHVIEIGPGKGSLTEEILKRNPKSLIVIEKDSNLAKELKEKYSKNKIIDVINEDVLKFDLEKIVKSNSIIFGNLPYNISSQILVKILRFNKWLPRFKDIVFMFQKELGDKIIGKFPSSNYGRISILTNFRLNMIKNFLVSPNCFSPKPKINSMVIHFKPKNDKLFNIKRINTLEKITSIFFSNKRKMINKNLKRILSDEKINKIKDLKICLRPSDIKPEIFYKITELYEGK